MCLTSGGTNWWRGTLRIAFRTTEAVIPRARICWSTIASRWSAKLSVTVVTFCAETAGDCEAGSGVQLNAATEERQHSSARLSNLIGNPVTSATVLTLGTGGG